QLLPATLPPLAWLQVPQQYVVSRLEESRDIPAYLRLMSQALKAGARLLQFRAPGWRSGSNDLELRMVLEQVLGMARPFGAKVLVNSVHPQDWWELADGVHLRSVDLLACTSAPSLPQHAYLGASCHSAAELEHARNLGASFAVLGPVLPT